MALDHQVLILVRWLGAEQLEIQLFIKKVLLATKLSVGWYVADIYLCVYLRNVDHYYIQPSLAYKTA